VAVLSRRRLTSYAFLVWAAGVTLAVAARFYVRGMAVSGGEWPAPLDDVYIHYDFARAWATGHPFEWIAGQGYSSGETSPAYAVLLAVGYLLGFRGEHLGVWAAALACASLVVVMWNVRLLVSATSRAHWVVPFVVAPVVVASGTLDFTWWSGMEFSVLGAALTTFLVAAHDARASGPVVRRQRQWRVGLLGAALVALRPETAIVVAVASFLVARRSGAASPWASMARVALPGAIITVAVACVNSIATGDAASAGAALKLLSSNPFSTDDGRARDYVTNFVSLLITMRRDLGAASGHWSWLLPALALLSLVARRTRGLGGICLGSAVAYVLLVSWNGAARYQNFRDYMPAVALVLFASSLGAAAIAGAGKNRLAWGGLAALAAVPGMALGASHVDDAARFYARASKNIHEQQVEAARRLARTRGPSDIVLLNDAGAIPYVSGLHAIDALGLGGYGRLPFVRASVHGEAATLELIERLPERQRPTVLALYPNWFPNTTRHFGHLLEKVTITDNVICGGDTKGIYDADWAGLRRDRDPLADTTRFGRAVLDELDVADVVSEEAHGYTSAAPRGGFTLFDVRPGEARGDEFDAGRTTPEGEEESFRIEGVASLPAAAEVVVRTDDTSCDVSVEVRRGESELMKGDLEPAERETHGPSAWKLRRLVLHGSLMRGDRIHLRVARGTLHDFHVWLVAPPGKP
jgi:hypothetical protein